jgi:hypothetical protein
MELFVVFRKVQNPELIRKVRGPTQEFLNLWAGKKKAGDFPASFSKFRKLNFFYCDGAGFTNFNTAFTTQALIHVDRYSLVVLKLKNTHRTGIHAIGIPGTFVGINRNLKH